jgi:hypothetical protein
MVINDFSKNPPPIVREFIPERELLDDKGIPVTQTK